MQDLYFESQWMIKFPYDFNRVNISYLNPKWELMYNKDNYHFKQLKTYI